MIDEINILIPDSHTVEDAIAAVLRKHKCDSFVQKETKVDRALRDLGINV